MHLLADEQASIREAVRLLTEFTGKAPKGWLGPGLTETWETLDHLAAAGFEYVCDWVADDQPFEIKTASGPLISVPYTQELNDVASRLKAASDKLEKDAPTLAEAERNRRQRDLVEQDRDFQRKRREYQEDVSQRKNEEMSSIVERANRVIKQIFDSEKYDLILQDAVFFSPRVDITKKVIDALNAGK